MSFESQQLLESKYMMSNYARKPLQFVRGLGMELFDDTGRRYLDFLAGIGAVSVGHCHPAVSAAICEQAEKLMHVGNYYHIENRGELSLKIATLLSESKDGSCDSAGNWRTFFANSGTEAIEATIKIARKHGRTNLGGAYTIVSAAGSFHGRSMGALAATGQAVKQEAFAPMPEGFRHVQFNRIAELSEALDDKNSPVCAVMLECIQGEGGVWPHDAEYLKQVRQETAKRNIALIIDEVQTGFYRSGNQPFAFQLYGITPDIVAMAKGMGNGFPVAAISARGEYGGLLQPGEHGSTFGGSALAIAAAQATIEVLTTSEIPNNVQNTGDYLRGRLKELADLSNVRGQGLMVGASLGNGQAHRVVDSLLSTGYVINATGPNDLRFLPPLICQKQDIDEMIEALKTVLKGL